MENDTEILEEAFRPDSKYIFPTLIFPIILLNDKKRKANADWLVKIKWHTKRKILSLCLNCSVHFILVTSFFCILVILVA